MNTAGVKRYCRSLPDVVETRYGAPDNWLVYSTRGRKFAYCWRGRYGWVTIVEVSRFPAQYLQELVRASYARAARGRA
jgi:hypothetical protein